jgi:hypothetical protein
MMWFIKAFLYSTVGLFMMFIFVVKVKEFAEGKPDWVRKNPIDRAV